MNAPEAPDITVMGTAKVIQVGTVLDKYELLERVGQGGMAIVYRGLDRSLKRQVAIKVLHKHLSDYQEARERFEREAQAVAKLRHENILEIYDYAAKSDEEAYIVTEFIDGQTLKQFITERPIAFPEVGAMVVLQVCRALAHAHAGMILHRDVKPENIMIRSDGVVKLMDFGISHIVDLERLTVTGQLLGSPAYMAPEHVEGKPIDFRTDVFAAGIVLYQLAVGRLPFEGKNPHEVLKRIAECKFVDPRVANPRIGNRLGRIILRAMAAEPADRYQAIGEMVIALESYCEESGLPGDKIAGELARYFKSPVPYEEALRARLLDHLTRRGQELLAKEQQSAALDVFDRVLTIDPKHAKVLAILDRIGRRRRLRTGLAIAVAAGMLGAGSVLVHRQFEPPDVDEPGEASGMSQLEPEREHQVAVAQEHTPAVIVAPADAGALVATVHVDAGSAAEVEVDAPPMVAVTPTKLIVFPTTGSSIAIGDGAFTPYVDGQVITLDHDAKVTARNDCCLDKSATIKSGDATATFQLTYKPARVLPKCDHQVDVKVDGKPATLGVESSVYFGDSLIGNKGIDVVFIGTSKETQHLTVVHAQVYEVTCAHP
jgi:serine/threonine-protein kinase